MIGYVFVISFFILAILVSIYLDKRDWNNGYCPRCNTKWRCFDMDSQGGRMYKCDNCGKHCDISWNVDKEK